MYKLLFSLTSFISDIKERFIFLQKNSQSRTISFFSLYVHEVPHIEFFFHISSSLYIVHIHDTPQG